jgi:hypothetical protein
MIAIVPLGNFDCAINLRLHNNIYVERTPMHVVPILQNALSKFFIRHPFPIKNLLIIRNERFDTNSKEHVQRYIEEIILLLRLYKQGSPFFNYIAVDVDDWYDNFQKNKTPNLFEVGVFFYMGWSHKGLDTIYKIDKSDEKQLENLFNKYLGKDIISNRACKFFFKGFHEPYSDDRFLNNAIGLENILVNDTKEQSNIRYKFIDRGCFLLQAADPKPVGAKYYSNPLKDIYDARCQLVHSNKSIINWADVGNQNLLKNSEEYLRTLLKYILANPKYTQAYRIDEDKRNKY